MQVLFKIFLGTVRFGLLFSTESPGHKIFPENPLSLLQQRSGTRLESTSPSADVALRFSTGKSCAPDFLIGFLAQTEQVACNFNSSASFSYPTGLLHT